MTDPIYFNLKIRLTNNNSKHNIDQLFGLYEKRAMGFQA